MRRAIKSYGKKLLYRLFVTGQRFGVSVLPLHYYSSVPDMHRLAARSDWKRPRSMSGIAMRPLAEQLALLGRALSSIPPRERHDFYARALQANDAEGGFGAIEAHVLAAFTANERIARVVQVGCGVSTAVMLDSAERQNRKLQVVCVEPYPNDYLHALSRAGRIELIESPAQAVDLELFTQLQAGDLLFIDSTHSVAPGSEVNRLILEVLPRLDPGVWVHFHDIYFPYDYARDFLSGDLFFPQETTLLYAFLLQNPSFTIELSLSMLHHRSATALKSLIAHYEPQGNDEGLMRPDGRDFPSSIYLKKIA